jgi:serine/threonine protein kinase
MNDPTAAPHAPPGAAETAATAARPTATADGLAPPERTDEVGRLAGYRVLGELGRGGMGVVYRAEDLALRREVALKVMRPELAAHPVARARFLREARAQAAIEHDHIAVIHHIVEFDGVPFLVMPLLKGLTLSADLKRNPRPPLGEAVRIGREVAEGLAAAHARGLVHRDVKPGNVWLEGDRRRVKVLDFGLARAAGSPDAAAVDAPRPPDNTEDDLLTRTGTVVGTPAYMSPEQAAGVPVDHRTDLYSLGVILYRMTTGVAPEADIRPPVELNPDVPLTLSDLVVRLLALDPDRRPATAAAVAAELRSVEAELAAAVRVLPAESLPSVVLPPAPDPFADIDSTEADVPVVRPAAPRPKSAWWLWPAVGLTVVLAGLTAAVAGGLIPLRQPKPPEDHADARPEPKKAPPPVVPVAEPPKAEPPKVAAKPPIPVFNPATATAEQKAAAILIPHAGLTVRTQKSKGVRIAAGQPLPPEPFNVAAVWFGNAAPPLEATRDACAAALAELPHLAEVGDHKNWLRWTDEDFARLAAGPAAGTLRKLNLTDTALTPAMADELQKMPALVDVGINLRKADDDLLLKLPQALPNLEVAVWEYLGSSGRVTARGADALANFPKLKRLSVSNARKIQPDWWRAIARLPELESLGVAYWSIDDATLPELIPAPKLATLSIGPTHMTGPGLDALVRMKSLKTFTIEAPNVPEAKLGWLRAARPDLEVRRIGPAPDVPPPK